MDRSREITGHPNRSKISNLNINTAKKGHVQSMGRLPELCAKRTNLELDMYEGS
jgi:hypothetical protein